MTSSYTLRTRSGEYAVEVAPDRSGLVLASWNLGGAASARDEAPAVAHSFQPQSEIWPDEYSVWGTRHLKSCDLLVDFGAGDTGALMSLVDVSLTEEDGISHLTAVHADATRRLRLVTHTITSLRHDVVSRWAEVTNKGDQAFVLDAAASGTWNLGSADHLDVTYLYGAWGHEFQVATSPLSPGSFTIGSRTGFTSHSFAPWASLTDAASDQVWSFSLAWCGSWRMQIDRDPATGAATVRGYGGEDTQRIVLEPGSTRTLPTTLGLLTRSDPSEAWHDFDREVLGRDLSAWNHPVVYNSWYATGFDVRADQQKELAREAARLGAEVFVVDDGWFTGRTSDRSGLGDWTPDQAKFPHGLESLVSEVSGLGMRFGIWVEPESVNAHSELYRTHPDWVYRANQRPLISLRNQYLLDFGRPDVVAWAKDWLRDLLTRYDISYLKWDLNRPVTDGGRPGDPHGREWSAQHARGYLEVMRMLRDEFPAVTVEACSGGGGRIDRSVLALCDLVWTSDETGPRDRLAIQDGFLMTHPPSIMCSWVTDMPDHRDRTPASDHFRCLVSLAGVMGIGADLRSVGPERATIIREWVDIYRRWRHVILGGTVTRHGRPSEQWYALEYRLADTALVLGFARPGSPPGTITVPADMVGGRWTRPYGGEQGVSGDIIEVDWRLGGDSDFVVLSRA